MIRTGFSHLKLTAIVAVLAISLIGLSGLLSVTTRAQDNETAPPREIDLREKLKNKKFDDGRRVELHTISTGEKIKAEVKGGKFLNVFLIASDGTEVKGVFKKEISTSNTQVCSATIVTTTRERKGLRMVTITTSTVVQFPCENSPST